MKYMAFIFALTASLSISSIAASLEQSTNDEILHELSYRLSHTSPSVGHSILYACSGVGRLRVVLPGANESEAVVAVGSYSDCIKQLEILRTKKRELGSSDSAFACSGTGALNRFSIKSDGTLNTSIFAMVGSYSDCLAQMQELNN